MDTTSTPWYPGCPLTVKPGTIDQHCKGKVCPPRPPPPPPLMKLSTDDLVAPSTPRWHLTDRRSLTISVFPTVNETHQPHAILCFDSLLVISTSVFSYFKGHPTAVKPINLADIRCYVTQRSGSHAHPTAVHVINPVRSASLQNNDLSRCEGHYLHDKG